MATSYEQALSQLFQSAHEQFVSERKRLSVELKAAGDKAGAARLARLTRPPVSAWAVNQLWWQAQSGFEQLFAAAARQRTGDRAAAGAHREQLAALRARAAELLNGAGHPATEATLRRVTMTLAALAAAGDFAPDPPGALTADRDPPGFEAAASGVAFEPPPKKADGGEQPQPERAQAERERAEREQAQRLENERRQAAAEEERRRLEAERARQAEQQRLQAAVRDAQAEVDLRARALARQREELLAAEKLLEKAQAVLDVAAARLKAFEDPKRS